MDLVTQNNILNQIIDTYDGVIYWKDVNGKYLGCNKCYLDRLYDENILSRTIGSIIGMTDYDIFDEVIADNYRSSDKLVIKNKNKVVIREISYTSDKFAHSLMSYKYPLFNNGAIIGVLGKTYDFTYFLVDGKKINLSTREIQVYAAIYLGMSMKEAGKKLGISPKTVEKHVASIKAKLNCKNKKSLIDIIINSNLSVFLKDILS